MPLTTAEIVKEMAKSFEVEAETPEITTYKEARTLEIRTYEEVKIGVAIRQDGTRSLEIGPSQPPPLSNTEEGDCLDLYGIPQEKKHSCSTRYFYWPKLVYTLCYLLKSSQVLIFLCQLLRFRGLFQYLPQNQNPSRRI